MTTQRPRSAGRPTLDEVAARAGVGRGTVSRVINRSPQVSAQARAAVEQAIVELGYVPNRAARTLVTQRTDSIALIVSESAERAFDGPFFAGVARGVSAGIADTQLQLWLALAPSSAERERVAHHLTAAYVDGVLLLSTHDNDPLHELLAERGLPTVVGGRLAWPTAGTPLRGFVDVDHVGGAWLAVAHLAAAGRRRVAIIAGPQDMGGYVARLAGYRQAVLEAGLSRGEDLIAYGDFSEASGANAMRALLAARPDIDAVFAASDVLAAGALRALRRAGRRVPDDVAVVGFDDVPLAEHTDPPLTTVRQPIEEMGRHMARLLVAAVGGQPLEAPYVLLDTHLVRRESA